MLASHTRPEATNLGQEQPKESRLGIIFTLTSPRQCIDDYQSASYLNELFDEGGGWVGGERVRKVIRIHDNGVLANEIERETESFDFVWIDIWEGSSIEGIAKDHLANQLALEISDRKLERTTAAILAATSGLTLAAPRLYDSYLAFFYHGSGLNEKTMFGTWCSYFKR